MREKLSILATVPVIALALKLKCSKIDQRSIFRGSDRSKIKSEEDRPPLTEEVHPPTYTVDNATKIMISPCHAAH